MDGYYTDLSFQVYSGGRPLLRHSRECGNPDDLNREISNKTGISVKREENMICAANWKMNMGVADGRAFLKDFKKLLKPGDKENMIFFPPAFLSFLFAEEVLNWGGQNVFFQKTGAYTGENSPQVLSELSARFCLLGHSERRLIFNETEEAVEKKFHLLLDLNIVPVLCVGEKDTERDQTERVLEKQLSFLKKCNSDIFVKKSNSSSLAKKYGNPPFIVAYEPVWAVGSGKTPSPNEISKTHEWIKNFLPAPDIPVLYGGSVTKTNAGLFGKAPFVDGLLVGGASLSAEKFYSIFQAGQTGALKSKPVSHI